MIPTKLLNFHVITKRNDFVRIGHKKFLIENSCLNLSEMGIAKVSEIEGLNSLTNLLFSKKVKIIKKKQRF